MAANTCLQLCASMTGTPVTGLTPPSASVAPMTARSVALTRRKHCRVAPSSTLR